MSHILLTLELDCLVSLKMVYLTGPDGLVNRRLANFHKTVRMTTVHVLIIHIHAVFFGNLHTLSLQGMQNILGFVTKSVLKKITGLQ